MKPKTMVHVTFETREDLKALKRGQESYDQVIRRLLQRPRRRGEP